MGQRIERFVLEAWTDGEWRKITEGTTVGYKRLLRFDEVTASRVRLSIVESRTSPTIASFGLYRSPKNIKLISHN